MAKPKQSELIAFRGDFIEAGKHCAHVHKMGGVNIRIDFDVAADSSSPTKIKVQIGDVVHIQDQPLNEKFPVVHIADRAGKHGVNLIVEVGVPAKGSEIPTGKFVRTLALVHRNNDAIQTIPDLNGFQKQVPQFAQRHPECFPKKDLLI
jgi:hypothetical protein